MVVRLSALRTGRTLPPGNAPGTHLCQRLSRPQGHSAIGRIMSMTPSGIEPATFRFVAQHLNDCATAVPPYRIVRYHNPEDPFQSRLLVIIVLYILLSSSHIMFTNNNCFPPLIVNENFDWKSGSEREPKFSPKMEAVCFCLKRH
jgi:hypothetical protein